MLDPRGDRNKYYITLVILFLIGGSGIRLMMAAKADLTAPLSQFTAALGFSILLGCLIYLWKQTIEPYFRLPSEIRKRLIGVGKFITGVGVLSLFIAVVFVSLKVFLPVVVLGFGITLFNVGKGAQVK